MELQFCCNFCKKGFCTKSKLETHIRSHLAEKPFSCYMCNTSFKTKAPLVNHIHSLHTMERPYPVECCKKRFVTVVQARIHTVRHTGIGMVGCTKCNKLFATSRYLLLHERIHNPSVKQFKCPRNGCLAGFHQSTHLKSHLIYAHSVREKCFPFNCPFCEGVAFEFLRDKYAHIKQLHPNESGIHACSQCSKVYKNTGGLRRHMNTTHQKSQSYPCTICSRVFYRRDGLQAHSISHSTARTITCTICPMTFRRSSALTTHIRKAHTAEKPYKCAEPDCLAEYRAKHLLQTHVKFVHVGKDNISRPHACPICGKGFQSKSHLTMHSKHHDTVKRYTCDLCSYKTQLSGNLKIHRENVHLITEKKWECAICNKKFKSKYQLGDHFRNHDKEKERSCYFCLRKFRTKQEIEWHLVTHTTERPYFCRVPGCGKSFTVPHSASVHEKIHGGVKPYRCSMCERSWYQKGNMDRHKCQKKIDPKNK